MSISRFFKKCYAKPKTWVQAYPVVPLLKLLTSTAMVVTTAFQAMNAIGVELADEHDPKKFETAGWSIGLTCAAAILISNLLIYRQAVKIDKVLKKRGEQITNAIIDIQALMDNDVEKKDDVSLSNRLKSINQAMDLFSLVSEKEMRQNDYLMKIARVPRAIEAGLSGYAAAVGARCTAQIIAAITDVKNSANQSIENKLVIVINPNNFSFYSVASDAVIFCVSAYGVFRLTGFFEPMLKNRIQQLNYQQDEFCDLVKKLLMHYPNAKHLEEFSVLRQFFKEELNEMLNEKQDVDFVFVSKIQGIKKFPFWDKLRTANLNAQLESMRMTQTNDGGHYQQLPL